MAKIQKKDGSLVVKKNYWSTISVWWGILVFGLIIPALFVVACLDINSYKEGALSYAEAQRSTIINQFNQELDADIAALEKDNTVRAGENNSLNEKIDAANAVIEEKTAEINRINAKVAVKGQKALEIATLEAEIAEIQGEIVKLNNQIKDVKNGKAPFEEQKSSLREEVDALTKQITALENQIKNKTTSRDNKVKTLNNLNNQKVKLEEEVNYLTKLVEIIKSHIVDQTQLKTAIEAEIDALKNPGEGIAVDEAKIKELEAEIIKINNTLNTYYPANEQESKNLEEKSNSLAALNARIESLANEIETIQGEIDNLNEQLTATKATNEPLIAEKNAKIADLNTEIKVFDDEIAIIQKNIDQKDGVIANKNKAIDKLNDEIDAIDKEVATIETLMVEIKTKQDEIKEYQKKIASNSATIEKNEKTVANWEKTYRANIKQLDADLENVIATKDGVAYDNLVLTSYKVSDDTTYKFNYTGIDSMLGLTMKFINPMLNPNNEMAMCETMCLVCIIIAAVFLFVVLVIQFIKLVIAKKTSWTFYDGAVIYKKGRIFYAEENTRDIEFFPGMSVSIRRTVKGKIFGYGDVILSNGAGEAGEIVMTGVKRPKKVQKLLRNLIAMACTRTANMMSPYKMYPQMYRHVLGGYPAYYYGAMQGQQQQPKK